MQWIVGGHSSTPDRPFVRSRENEHPGRDMGSIEVVSLPRIVTTLSGTADLRRIDVDALDAHRDQWLPYLGDQADAGWNWGDHRDAVGTEYGRLPGQFLDHLAVWSKGALEGMMIFSGAHSCIGAAHAGASAVYVEFLAVAPWQRPIRHVVRPEGAFQPPSGIGACLMGEAIADSFRRGWRGTVGWHAKASSVANYEKMFHRACGVGPLLCGTDAESGEVAMEVTAALAAAWCRS